MLDEDGRLLLPTDVAHIDKHLRYFQMWGIAEADVVDDQPADPAVDPIHPERLAAAGLEVRPFFRHTNLDHPVIAQLFKHCVAIAARRQLD